LLLVEGDHADDVPAWLGALGAGPPREVVAAVSGLLLWPTVQTLTERHAQGPLGVVAVARAPGWTVIADPEGVWTDDLPSLQALSRAHPGRTIALVADDDECRLSWLVAGVERRGRDATGAARGEPLPIEAAFEHPGRLWPSDLLAVMQSLGLDPVALGRDATWTVIAF
jgi:hypothetical protein